MLTHFLPWELRIKADITGRRRAEAWRTEEWDEEAVRTVFHLIILESKWPWNREGRPKLLATESWTHGGTGEPVPHPSPSPISAERLPADVRCSANFSAPSSYLCLPGIALHTSPRAVPAQEPSAQPTMLALLPTQIRLVGAS